MLLLVITRRYFFRRFQRLKIRLSILLLYYCHIYNEPQFVLSITCSQRPRIFFRVEHSLQVRRVLSGRADANT